MFFPSNFGALWASSHALPRMAEPHSALCSSKASSSEKREMEMEGELEPMRSFDVQVLVAEDLFARFERVLLFGG